MKKLLKWHRVNQLGHTAYHADDPAGGTWRITHTKGGYVVRAPGTPKGTKSDDMLPFSKLASAKDFAESVARELHGMEKKGNPTPKCPRGTEVASLIFAKNKGWSRAKARDWAKGHGFSYGDERIEETGSSWRIRQKDEGYFEQRRVRGKLRPSFRTIPFGSKVSAVIGCPKKGRKSNPKKKKRKAPDYAGTHEGEPGPVATFKTRVPDPFNGQLTDMGEIRQITYRTTKGSDDAPTDYVHSFRTPRPRLLYTDDGKGLVLSTGKFRITTRGIVG